MPRLVRDRLTWVIYVQLALWCYFLYGFGPVAPLLRDELHISRTLASLHGTGFAVGGIIGGAVIPALTRRYGRHRLIWGGLTLSAPPPRACSPRTTSRSTLAFATLASFGGSLLVNGVVAALTEHHGSAGPAAISEANAAAPPSAWSPRSSSALAYGIGLGWRGRPGRSWSSRPSCWRCSRVYGHPMTLQPTTGRPAGRCPPGFATDATGWPRRACSRPVRSRSA